MEKQKRKVVCPENDGLATYMLDKRHELAKNPKGISEKIDATLANAYNGVCMAKSPIKTQKDFSQIKGVGKWIIRQMQGYFDNAIGSSQQPTEDLVNKGKRPKGAKRYVPQKNSVAYALLITLYRHTANTKQFMLKQELIDVAEASGLSRAPIQPDKGKGKALHSGSSLRDWYSGWNCMKTLITKGLVVKSSCPAKYMLTEEGKDAARECLARSSLVDKQEILDNPQGSSDNGTLNETYLEGGHHDSGHALAVSSVGLSGKKKSFDLTTDSLERFLNRGFSRDQVLLAFSEVSKDSKNKDLDSLWPSVLCRLQEDEIYGVRSRPLSSRNNHVDIIGGQGKFMDLSCGGKEVLNTCLSLEDDNVGKLSNDGAEANMNVFSMPPLSLGESFEDLYEVILILDAREHFTNQGSKRGKLIESISNENRIKIEVRQLPIGDGIWIARHKYQHNEYVLDFIVERKNIDDLRSSIRDNRYRDQKLRLLRCGLKKLMYLVEGDPNSSEAAESIRTACFTTEVLEGFDVQRTTCLLDTLKKYCHLTKSITRYYKSRMPVASIKYVGICPSFNEFVKRCQELDKMTVGDVFATQLMQVPQVTDEVATAVLRMYPTLISLARAYSLHEGDSGAQQDLLRKQSNNIVGAVASRNIFQLVWGEKN